MTEKQTLIDLKKSYREAMKAQFLKEKDHSKNEFNDDQITRFMDKNLELEEKFMISKREKEKQMLRESLFNAGLKKETAEKERAEEVRRQNEALLELSNNQLFQSQKEAQRKREYIREARKQYEEAIESKKNIKQKKLRDEQIKEKEFLDLLDKNSKDQNQREESIKLRLQRLEEFGILFDQLCHQEPGRKDLLIEILTNQNALSSIDRQIESNRALLDKNRGLSKENLASIKAQMKENELAKDLLLYEEKAKEYEELEKIAIQLKGEQKEEILCKRKAASEFLESLKQQINNRQGNYTNSSNLNRHEYRINKDSIDCYELDKSKLPGFEQSSDRLRQVEIVKNSIQKNQNSLESTFKVSSQLGTRSIIRGRRSTFKPQLAQSQLQGPSPIQNLPISTSYQLNKERGRTSLVLETNPLNPW